MKDYYYILGITKTASDAQIKTAYRKLSLKFHPDKNDGDKFFEERFKDIQEAYEILSNSEKRIIYDSKLDNFSFGNSKTNTAEYEEFLRKKYEEELRKREEEIKRKYQTPEQRVAEEAEKKRREDERREKEEKQKLIKEIDHLRNLLLDKEKLLYELNSRTTQTKADIQQIRKTIEAHESKLSQKGGEKSKSDENFVFVLNQHQDIIAVLESIKKMVQKDEQLDFLHMLLCYAKSFSIAVNYTDKYPYLLKLITDEKIQHRPLYYIYNRLKKNGLDTKPFETELVNYIKR